MNNTQAHFFVGKSKAIQNTVRRCENGCRWLGERSEVQRARRRCGGASHCCAARSSRGAHADGYDRRGMASRAARAV